MGTRNRVKINKMDSESVWKNDYPWMALDTSKFPTKSIQAIKLNH